MPPTASVLLCIDIISVSPRWWLLLLKVSYIFMTTDNLPMGSPGIASMQFANHNLCHRGRSTDVGVMQGAIMRMLTRLHLELEFKDHIADLKRAAAEAQPPRRTIKKSVFNLIGP